MNPQDQAAAASTIDAIASKRMGVAPQQQQAPAQAQTKPAPDSNQDKAANQGSPQTEGDKIKESPLVFEIDFDENDKRKLTPEQIKSTFQRYSDLNYKQAQYKPILDLVENIRKANPNATPKQIAAHMDAIMRAQSKNPTMGNTAGDQSGDNKAKPAAMSPDDVESQLKKWEEDNAASLPPGYKDMMKANTEAPKTMAQMRQAMGQMQKMLQAVLAQTQGVADAARTGTQQAQTKEVSAIKQTIANNIDRVQQHLKLPDESANDFMVFAAERGFTLEDFVDPGLTIKVMQDFKNQMSSPEMERMRQIAQRRQAYTGSMGATPSAGGEGPGASGPDAAFEQMASAAMSKRGMA